MATFTVNDSDASVIASTIKRYGPLTTERRGSRAPFTVGQIRYASFNRLEFRRDSAEPWRPIRTRAMLDLLFEAADRAEGNEPRG